MKKLTCELCGSTDFIKENGVFVCQSCGCKYSIDEARKLMNESIVQVEGVVKVDDTDKVATYKEIAINAYNSGNTKEAYQYFLKVLEINPTDYQSIFYKGMCRGWETSLLKPHVAEAVNAYHQAVKYIPDDISKATKITFVNDLISLMSAWFDKAQQNFFNVEDFYQSNSDIFYQYMGVGEKVIKYIDGFMDVIINSSSAKLLEEAGELYCSACEALCTNIIIWTDYSKDRAIFSGLSGTQKQPYIKSYETMIFEVRKYDPSFRKPTSQYGVIDRMDPPTSLGVHNIRTTEINYEKCLAADKLIEQRLQKYKDAIIQKQKKECIEKYWSMHPEEKQKYNERLAVINAQLKTLNNQNAPFIARIEEIKKDLAQSIPEEVELASLKNQQNDLMTQKSKLGLFAGKQKKALQAQIDSLQMQIDQFELTVKHIKRKINDAVNVRINSVNSERQHITLEISALEEEKDQINFELTKDR